jgi:hypothetical protein
LSTISATFASRTRASATLPAAGGARLLRGHHALNGAARDVVGCSRFRFSGPETGCALTVRQRPKSACRLATSGACARTIGPRVRMNRLDDASGKCSVSNRPDRPNDSCLFTPPSKTRSTSNAISPPAARSASSETKRSGRGEPPPRPEPELRLPIFTRPKFSSRDSAATLSGCTFASPSVFEMSRICSPSAG